MLHVVHAGCRLWGILWRLWRPPEGPALVSPVVLGLAVAAENQLDAGSGADPLGTQPLDHRQLQQVGECPDAQVGADVAILAEVGFFGTLLFVDELGLQEEKTIVYRAVS
ncbi:unnamed protein product [Ixodes pacificus]